MDERPRPKAELLGRLPPPWPEPLFPEIARRVRAQPRKIAVLDDDPTGTQTVHSLWVWTVWEQDALHQALAEAAPAFFLLTNSRSLPEEEAIRLNREIARNLMAVARERGVPVDVVSRSDSTLRGHFPAEVDALREVLEAALGRPYDGVILCPFFLEGGRLTVGDVHWVLEGDQATPAAQTEFARDVTFG
ncbi:MAG: hydroxyacid dehydrogenase, partial [Anaerolineae bacterium]|nr:hydroxyacid dehydrogenase [Anaerolineae bacterium]